MFSVSFLYGQKMTGYEERHQSIQRDRFEEYRTYYRRLQQEDRKIAPASTGRARKLQAQMGYINKGNMIQTIHSNNLYSQQKVTVWQRRLGYPTKYTLLKFQQNIDQFRLSENQIRKQKYTIFTVAFLGKSKYLSFLCICNDSLGSLLDYFTVLMR